MSVQVSPYVTTPVVPFVTLQTIGLPVTGAAGTVPVSQGVGQSTVFQALPAPNLSAAVILAPDSPTRNLVQPTADANVGIRLKQHSLTQTGMLGIYESSAGALQGWLSGKRAFMFVGDDPDLASFDDDMLNFGPSVILATSCDPNNGSRGGMAGVSVVDPATKIGVGEFSLCIRNKAAALPIVEIGRLGGSMMQTNAGVISQGQLFLGDSSGNRLLHFDFDSTSSFWGGFDASSSVVAIDYGTTKKFGAFGNAAVVKQAGASAAGIAAVVDANAKAALTALQAALAAYGLVTSPA